eukprot:GHVU01023219.1.p1 GENE.GHVU01023219.1~~GHVU01023219.1.p1  ORF type:complete len:159 (-),score=5.45 GHVU01023219.1:1765-2241(-)
MSELKFELSKVGNDNAIQKLKEDIGEHRPPLERRILLFSLHAPLIGVSGICTARLTVEPPSWPYGKTLPPVTHYVDKYTCSSPMHLLILDLGCLMLASSTCVDLCFVRSAYGSLMPIYLRPHCRASKTLHRRYGMSQMRRPSPKRGAASTQLCYASIE